MNELATITSFVAKELSIGAETIDVDAPLRDLPGADSVKLLRIVGQIERHYQLEFEDDQIFAAKNVSDLANLVTGALG